MSDLRDFSRPWLLLTASLGLAGAVLGAEPFEAFLEKHCIGCHGPEKEKKKPTQAEMAAFVTNLDSRIKEGRASRMAARPAVAHYRLSRKEYQNTVYDLLGVRYDPAKPGELNEDIFPKY